MEIEDLVGKTIISASQKKLAKYDDEGFLELKFSDGTKALIESWYSGYTGDSEDEYPTGISIYDDYDYDKLIDL